MFSKEELTPHALQLFKEIKNTLPESIGDRLRSNKHFVTHGSYRTLFLFDIWDANQNDLLDRKHFKYCLGYDGRPGAVRNGYCHLWLNRVRIYRCRDKIIDTLDRELEAAVPKGFTWHPHKGRAFNIGFAFDYPRDLSQLPAFLLPYYIDLISAIHPLLMPLIDLVAAPPAPGERREAVASRGRLPFTPPGVFDRKRVREYTRSIPSSWKVPILDVSDQVKVHQR